MAPITPSQVIVYVSPKVDSDWTIWCLEPVDQIPSIARLFARLQAGLPKAEIAYTIICHDKSVSEKLGEALKGLGVTIVQSKAFGRLEAVTEFVKAQAGLKTLLIFHEQSLFPDCRLTQQILQLHRERGVEATFAADYPPGLVPEIYEVDAIKRLAGLELPEDVSADFYSVLLKANQLFGDDPEMTFKVLAVDSAMVPDGPVLQKLPAKLLLDSVRDQTAASEVVKKGFSARSGPEAAYRFKEERLRLEGEPTVLPFARINQDGRIPILFCTPYTAFSGAEESFANLIIHLDRNRFRPLVVLLSRGVLSDKLEKGGVEVFVTGFDFSISCPSNARLFKTLIGDFGIRLVHMNGDAGTPLLFAAYAAGIPIVNHVRRFDGRSAPETMKFASKIITISDAVREDLLRSDLDPRKVQRVYNGQNLTTFDPGQFNKAALRQAAGIGPKNLVITMIARICAQKRQDFMLQALPSVIQKFPKALVLLVGETYASEAVYARQLRQTIGAMGLEKHVRFWGFERDIAKIHAMSDTLILCTENEPFGRSILEALAMGVPVVLPNRGGFTEIIRHGANGLLYDASDARSLSGALMNILFDANLRAKLAAAGRETIQSLDIATHVREVSQIYEDLLK